jgi:hypothetical protein
LTPIERRFCSNTQAAPPRRRQNQTSTSQLTRCFMLVMFDFRPATQTLTFQAAKRWYAPGHQSLPQNPHVQETSLQGFGALTLVFRAFSASATKQSFQASSRPRKSERWFLRRPVPVCPSRATRGFSEDSILDSQRQQAASSFPQDSLTVVFPSNSVSCRLHDSCYQRSLLAMKYTGTRALVACMEV